MTQVKEIISSGILEEFVFGNPSKEVQAKVAAYIIDYPEIRSYIKQLELSLEKVALEHTVEPPAEWKSNVLRNIKGKVELEKPETISIIQRYDWIKYIVSFLLGGLLVGTFGIYRQNQLQEKLEHSEAKIIKIVEECEAEQQYFTKQKKMLQFIQNPETEIVLLDNMSANSESEILVYWNKQSREAVAKIHILAKLTEKETYQLWADVAGEMINVGILQDEKNELVSLEFIENAESLNVTIEPKGGSLHPTISRLVLSTKL